MDGLGKLTMQKLHHVFTYPITIFTSLTIKSYAYTAPPISNEHQPLLRTLSTRLDDESDERLHQVDNDVESDLDQLIALKNRRIGGGISYYGIPFIVTCFFSFFSLNLVLYTYSAFPCSSQVYKNKLYSLITRHMSFAYIRIYAINILHHSPFITVSLSRPYHRLFILSDRIKSTSSSTYTQHLPS